MSAPNGLRRAAPALLFSALVLFVWADPLWTGRNFTGRDLLAYNLPMEKTIHDAYASGTMPVWNPYVSGGRPLLPNPNSGAMYPIRPMLAALPFPLAMRIYPVLHWIAAGLGVLALLARLQVGAPAAWLGAVTYVFSGASVSETFYPHIQPGFALLPWIVWALHRRRARGGTVVLAALVGLDFLAADIFTAGLAVGICLLWIATETARPDRRRETAALALAVGLGALLALPQIVATALWIPETNRAVLGMKLSDVTLFSVSPWRLVEFLVPYPFGSTWELRPAAVWGWRVFNGRQLGLFSTLFVGAIAPLAVVRLARRSLPGLSFARWLLGLGLAVCVLPSLIPRSWGSWSAPLPLRNPEKLVVAAVFALAIFAARGWEDFRRQTPARAATLSVGAILAAAALAAAAWPAAVGRLAAGWLGTLPAHAATAAVQIPAALSEAGLLWMATVVALDGASSQRRGIRFAALALLALVPISATRKLVEISHPAEAFAPTAFALKVRRWDPRGAFRVLGEAIYHAPIFDEVERRTDLSVVERPRRDWIQHTSALWARGTVFNFDFDSGDLARVESLRKVSQFAAGFQDAGAFFGNLALRWGIRMQGHPPVAAYRRIGGDLIQEWDELSPSFPDLRLARRWREEPGSVAALAALPGVGPGELLLETGGRGSGSARAGRISILEKSANRLRLECESPDPTWLFVLRAFWRHRTVEIDGREAEAVPAYLAFSAVPIPAGVHRVDWRERIPGIGISRWGPVLFLLAAAWILRPRGERPGLAEEDSR